MSSSFIATIRRAMQPLVDQFSLRVAEEAEDSSGSEVLFVNNTTGLRVRLDWRDFRPILTVYRLVDGEMPTGQPPSEPHLRRLAFDVDDLLMLRAPSGSPVGKMLGERDHQSADQLLSEYALALEQNAADVLQGDFSVFPTLERIVAERYAQLSGSGRAQSRRRKLP